MLVHKFNTKQIADEAMQYLNQIHGLPVKDGLTKFDEISYYMHPDGFYYMPYSEDWTSELIEPIEIALPTNNNE